MSLIFFKENIRYTLTLTYPVRKDLRLCVKDISNFYTLREGHWPHSMQKYLTFQNFVFKTSKLTCSKSTYQGIYKNRVKNKRKSFEIPVNKEIQFQSGKIQGNWNFPPFFSWMSLVFVGNLNKIKSFFTLFSCIAWYWHVQIVQSCIWNDRFYGQHKRTTDN